MDRTAQFALCEVLEMNSGKFAKLLRGQAMQTRLSVHAIVRSFNTMFWMASVGTWLWIVIHSGIWSVGFASKVFWINFLIFLAAGLGTAATTHFWASALPLFLGVMSVTAHDVKAAWAWMNLYVVAAAAIGLFSGIVKLSNYLSTKRCVPTNGDP